MLPAVFLSSSGTVGFSVSSFDWSELPPLVPLVDILCELAKQRVRFKVTSVLYAT